MTPANTTEPFIDVLRTLDVLPPQCRAVTFEVSDSKLATITYKCVLTPELMKQLGFEE